jgi:hypothetical protein
MPFCSPFVCPFAISFTITFVIFLCWKAHRLDLLEGFQKIFPHLRNFNGWIDEDTNGGMTLDHYAFDIKKQFKEGAAPPHPDQLHPLRSK